MDLGEDTGTTRGNERGGETEMMDFETFLKCLMITEISIIGSFCMYTILHSIWSYHLMWAATLGAILLLMFSFGWWDSDRDDPTPAFFTGFLNGIMINFGGYFAIILYLRFRFGFQIPIFGV